MADERIRQPVKITDPLTDANEAGVDANGDLQVVIPTSITPGTAAANLGKAEDVASAAADTGVAAFAVQDAALAGLSSVDDDYTWLRVDANGALWVSISAALPTGTNSIGDIANIGTSVTPGVAAGNLGKAVDAAAGAADTGVAMLGIRDDSPGYAAEIDGDYVTARFDVNGRLHVTDPNAGAGSPTNPVVESPALASIAAGATSIGTELLTSDLGGTTKQLAGIEISSSAPFKATIIEENDDAETIKVRGIFGKAGETLMWRPPNRAYFNKTFAANAGFDGWRVEVTNLDTSQTTDFYVTFYYED